MRQGVFRARELGLLFGRFSLGPPYEEFQKMADFWCLCKIGHYSDLAALLELRFAVECCPMIGL